MTDYKRVAAIDVGYRNFACCILDNQDLTEPLFWEVCDLWPVAPKRRRQPTKLDLVAITVQWCRQHNEQLALCDVIVLENQIREPCIIMNTVVQALYFDKAQVVHPMTVGAYWHLPPTRDAKKQAGIEVVRQHGVVLVGNKVDDLADTWLMAAWVLLG